jgi:hypothetical protein
MNTTADAVYPVPEPAVDGNTQFTAGLLFDIADVLVRHGYPRPTTRDWTHPMTIVYDFCYRERP